MLSSVHKLRVIDCRFLEVASDEMQEHTLLWGKMLYPLLVHGVPHVRNSALECLKCGMSLLTKDHGELAPHLKEDLENVRFVLSVWKKII